MLVNNVWLFLQELLFELNPDLQGLLRHTVIPHDAPTTSKSACRLSQQCGTLKRSVHSILHA